MTQPKPPTVREQAAQRLQEEALLVAKSTQAAGQTKEQTKLIAKGIEKGIAFYKQQQKAKARELDKARKKALRTRSSETDAARTEEPPPEDEWTPSPAKPALLAAGMVFSLAALLHGLRFLLGWHVTVGNFEVPMSWSLAAIPVAAGLAFWMFRANRD